MEWPVGMSTFEKVSWCEVNKPRCPACHTRQVYISGSGLKCRSCKCEFDKDGVGVMIVDINYYDFGSLLVYAQRYAINRRTAASFEVQNIIRRQFKLGNIDDLTIHQVLKDINNDLEAGRVPKDEVDGWVELRDLLKSDEC